MGNLVSRGGNLLKTASGNLAKACPAPTGCPSTCQGNDPGSASIIATGPIGCTFINGVYQFNALIASLSGCFFQWIKSPANYQLRVIYCSVDGHWYGRIDTGSGSLYGGSPGNVCAGAFGYGFALIPDGIIVCSSGRPSGAFILPGLGTCIGQTATVTF